MATNNSQKLNKLNWLLVIAILLLIITLGFYFFNFKNGLGADSSNWGTFGDFMGGTLNPLFALFSLFAIIYTIKIQTQELELSRDELEATRTELAKSAKSQEEQCKSFEIQNQSIKQQTFENTFFKLLEQFNGLLDEFHKRDEINSNYRTIFYVEKNMFNVNEIKKKFLEHNEGTMKVCFMTLYQIIKFVNDNVPCNGKLYTNIIRASLDDKLLCLLAVNCLTDDFAKYKKLLEDYSLLEHLNINTLEEGKVSTKMLNILKEYNIKAFDNNTELIKLLEKNS